MKTCSGAEDLKKLLINKLKLNEQVFAGTDFPLMFVEGLSSPVRVGKTGEILHLSKCHNFTDSNAIDFEFKFRVKKNGSTIELWPISFQSSEKGKLVAELEMNGRRLINAVVQDELIEIANTWSKGLAAQVFSRSLERPV